MAAYEATRLLAADLTELGINTDCAPVLDLPVAGAHDIIGDRAYGRSVDQVVALAKAVGEGFMAGGVVPVIKHIPGHGRATADSHLSLPVVTESRAELSATDFAPFKALNHMPTAMTAHVVFRDIDAGAPASTSADRHARDHPRRDRLRRAFDERRPHHEGADGPDARARRIASLRRAPTSRFIAAAIWPRCVQAAAGSGTLAGRAQQRFETAVKITKATRPFDSAAAEAQLAKVLAIAAGRAESV